METFRIGDKQFEALLAKEEIATRIKQLASEINRDYKSQSLHIVSVLNGAFMFTTDLLKEITVACKVFFTRPHDEDEPYQVSEITNMKVVGKQFKGKQVLILEDIIDSGISLEQVINDISEHKPASIKVASLIVKKDVAMKMPDYTGFLIENKFVLGYGMDYQGYGRNLGNIYIEVNA